MAPSEGLFVVHHPRDELRSIASTLIYLRARARTPTHPSIRRDRQDSKNMFKMESLVSEQDHHLCSPPRSPFSFLPGGSLANRPVQRGTPPTAPHPKSRFATLAPSSHSPEASGSARSCCFSARPGHAPRNPRASEMRVEGQPVRQEAATPQAPHLEQVPSGPLGNARFFEQRRTPPPKQAWMSGTCAAALFTGAQIPGRFAGQAKFP